MGFIQDLEKELAWIYKKTCAPYNIAAYSYKHLKDMLTSRGIEMGVFIAELIEFSDKDIILQDNYNTVWRVIVDEIRRILDENAAGLGRKEQYMRIPDIIRTETEKLKPIPYNKDGSRIDECINSKIINVETMCDGQKYLSKDILEEMAAYFVIKAVGAFANEKENDNRFKAVSSSNLSEKKSEECEYDEPLNSFFQDSVKIFRRASTKNVWEFNYGELPIQRHDSSTNLGINGSNISGILLFDPPTKKNINIRYVSSKKKLIKRGSGEDISVELTIMEVPFIGIRNVTKFEKISGSAFTVSHDEDYDNDARILIEKYMYLALHHKVNIVIFPEFMISKAVLAHLKKFLAEHRMEDLLFVVAGSCWDNNNNISRILDFKGEQLTVTYKTNGYKLGDSESGEWDEALKNPGKVIQILEYEGVGRVSNLICRDVYDESYNAVANIISDLFEPNFFFIPAWSKSIERAFRDGCTKLAKHGAISITSNCCEPVIEQNYELKKKNDTIDIRRKQRGICTFPSKENPSKHNNMSQFFINCEKGNVEKCPYEHCAFIMTLEFSKRSFESGNYFKENSFKHILLSQVVFDDANKVKEVDSSAVLSGSKVSDASVN